MKVFGIILVVLGFLSIIGSLNSTVEYAPGIRAAAFILQLAMIIGGATLISKGSNNKER